MPENNDSHDKAKWFLAPLFAATLGSTPATYISFEMYSNLTRDTAVNQQALLTNSQWIIRSERQHDNYSAELEKIKIQLAKAGY